MSLQSMAVGEQFPRVADTMAIQLAEYITIYTNYCGYGGTEEELIVNYVHMFFLNSKSTASQEDNKNWREATTGVSSGNDWKTMKANIAILESMGAW